ncbi:hypothetical protein MUCCIDRAFT_154839 [Mucor lusitanicus CBS 277.49]|uniref:Uncharacterized protein n=1 Tax=Mucor lusitanicus CBS 277.49 TaxID=747725 RepID=A0A162TYE9_MUCCL|nr:hypothetical protein MUCCIDRAFT_154839 [Mucor lusitanicus CBS 277.49]
MNWRRRTVCAHQAALVLSFSIQLDAVVKIYADACQLSDTDVMVLVEICDYN